MLTYFGTFCYWEMSQSWRILIHSISIMCRYFRTFHYVLLQFVRWATRKAYNQFYPLKYIWRCTIQSDDRTMDCHRTQIRPPAHKHRKAAQPSPNVLRPGSLNVGWRGWNHLIDITAVWTVSLATKGVRYGKLMRDNASPSGTTKCTIWRYNCPCFCVVCAVYIQNVIKDLNLTIGDVLIPATARSKYIVFNINSQSNCGTKCANIGTNSGTILRHNFLWILCCSVPWKTRYAVCDEQYNKIYSYHVCCV